MSKKKTVVVKRVERVSIQATLPCGSMLEWKTDDMYDEGMMLYYDGDRLPVVLDTREEMQHVIDALVAIQKEMPE